MGKLSDMFKDFEQQQKGSLHPPIAPKKQLPKPIKIKQEVKEELPEPMNIGRLSSWNEAKQWLLTNSSIDRGLREFVKKIVPGWEGVTSRGPMPIAQQQIAKAQEETLDAVELMRKAKAGDYREVMKELKLKLEDRKNSLEELN